MFVPKSAAVVIVGLALAACAGGPNWMGPGAGPGPGPVAAPAPGPGPREGAGTVVGAGTGAVVGAAVAGGGAETVSQAPRSEACWVVSSAIALAQRSTTKTSSGLCRADGRPGSGPSGPGVLAKSDSGRYGTVVPGRNINRAAATVAPIHTPYILTASRRLPAAPPAAIQTAPGRLSANLCYTLNKALTPLAVSSQRLEFG